MILAFKKCRSFVLYGIGALLFLSSCGKMEYSRENLIEALEAFAQDQGSYTGRKFDQLLREVRDLDKSFKDKLRNMDGYAGHILKLEEAWSEFRTRSLPALQSAAQDLADRRGDFDELLKALDQVQGVRDLHIEIKGLNTQVNQLLRGGALENLERLSNSLDGLDADKVRQFGISVQDFITQLIGLLNDDNNGQGTIEDRIAALRQSLGTLHALAEAVNTAVKQSIESQAALQRILTTMEDRLKSILATLERLEGRTKDLGSIAGHVATIVLVSKELQKKLAAESDSTDER